MQNTRTRLIKRERRLRLFSVIALLALGFIIILKVDNMLVSFMLAFVITYLFKPIVSHLESRGFSRTLSITIPFLLTGSALALLIILLSPLISSQLSSFQQELPKYADGITKLLGQIETSINDRLSYFTEVNISEHAGDFFQSQATEHLSNLPKLATTTFTTLLLAPFFAFFMLRDGRNTSRQLLALVPNNVFELALSLSHQINEQLGGFIRARLLEALIVGIVVLFGLWVLDFPYASFLAFFAGITNLIPYIGPVIGAIPALAVAFINQEPGFIILMVAFVYAFAQIIDMLFIIPLVVARIVNLHPITVVITIIIGSQLMGVLGMIISIPVASALKLTTSAVYNHVVGFRV